MESQSWEQEPVIEINKNGSQEPVKNPKNQVLLRASRLKKFVKMAPRSRAFFRGSGEPMKKEAVSPTLVGTAKSINRYLKAKSPLSKYKLEPLIHTY